MKNIGNFGILIMIIIISSCSKTLKIENAAKKQMVATFKEVANDPSNVKVSNIETKFVNDSLCILSADVSAKNGLGVEIQDKCEYIYIMSKGKLYEAYQDVDSDNEGIFQTEEKYAKEKKGKIYESLSYSDGLRYLAAIFVNEQGREVGNKKGDVLSIPVPTGTGVWQINSSQNEFGEKVNDKYLFLTGKGFFSNSATTDAELTSVLFIEESGAFALRLIEYDSNIVKNDDFYNCKIKDPEGNIYEFDLVNDEESGDFHLDNTEAENNMQKILGGGGVVSVSIKKPLYGFHS